MSIWDGDNGALPGGVPPDLLTRLLQSGALAGLLSPAMDPAAQAAAARDAAGATLQARMGKRTPQPSPFDAAPGALPDAATGGMPFAGLLNSSGGFGPAPTPPAPDLPPSTNDPEASEPDVFKGGVPLPRPRPSAAGGIAPPSPQEDPEAAFAADQSPAAVVAPNSPVPFSMAPEGLPAPAASAVGSGMNGILGKIFNPNHAGTMLALGAGFAGAGSIGTGMRRAFSNAVPAVAADRAYEQKQLGQSATFQALIRKGVPMDEATAAVNNPDILKATIGKYFETKPRTFHTIKDALGGETPITLDQNGKAFDLAGKPITGASDTPGGVGAGGPGGSILAPGVKYDPNLTGDDYLNQFSKDVQAAAKSYMNGDVLPSGNPRQKSIANFAKTVAQRYGQDMGIPVSDATFSEKRKYRMELGSNSANSAGGQTKAFNQAVEHADALATKLERLGNYDPVGVPGVARGVNWMREAFSTKQASVAKEAQAIGQTLAGEVGKLFSGSAGGGVHERELTRNRFNTVSSPAELAGALEGTLETMEGGLRALEQRRDSVLGPNNDVKLVTAETQAKVARIRDVITRLRGEGAPAPATPAAPIAPLKPGEVKTINGVTIRRVD